MQKEKRKNSSGVNIWLFAGIVAIVVIAALALILISSNNASNLGSLDYSEIPQERLEDGGFVLGDPDAPISIVAFEDFLCPHCQAYKPTVNRMITELVEPGLARFEFRILPAVDPTYSEVAGKLAVCSEELGGNFWESYDILFELASAQRFNENTSRTFAERVNIPYADLLDCVAEEDQVSIDTALARQLGVTGTPTVMYRLGDAEPTFFPSQREDFDAIKDFVEQVQ